MKKDDILIIPPQGKRKGRIILEACYKSSQNTEEENNLNSIIYKTLVKNGLYDELKKKEEFYNQ